MSNDVENGAHGRTPSMAPFFALWSGQVFSLLGSQLAQFALVWWLTRSTGSATVLALATMMALLPQGLLGPLAGALVDRWNRRTVMMLADGSVAVATLALAALFAMDAVQVGYIYALMLFRATAVTFHWPAMQASITLMVPEKHLSRIAGLNQTLLGAVTIVAPPLGALLLEMLPMHDILAINTGAALLAVSPLLFIRIPLPARIGLPGGGSSVLADVREGLRYVSGQAGLVMVVVIVILVNLLLTPAFSLQPLLITRHFAGGAPELAWLQSALGIGMVLGGLTLGAWGGFRRRVVTGLSALSLAGLGMVAVGMAPSTALSMAVVAMFFTGFMFPMMNGSMFAVMQSTIPAEIQGRVFALIMSGATVMTPLGLAVAGPVADALGVQVWFVAGGIVTSAVALASFFVPALTRMEESSSLSARIG